MSIEVLNQQIVLLALVALINRRTMNTEFHLQFLALVAEEKIALRTLEASHFGVVDLIVVFHAVLDLLVLALIIDQSIGTNTLNALSFVER